MTTLKTDYPKNFTKAENDLFSWNSSFPDFLTHKPTGQQIYQMQWYVWKNSQPITDASIRAAVIEFLDALKDAKKRSEEYSHGTDLIETDPEPRHGQNGYCRKCHSYCYGDCGDN